MKKYFLFYVMPIIALLSFSACSDEDEEEEDALPSNYIVDGTLPGYFSTSKSTKIQFSMGNLQYQASTNTWRFASNQYDAIKDGNVNISPSYDGWIDLFGFGTSGWQSGATNYQPYSTSVLNEDYFVFATKQYNFQNDYINGDWGIYNAISNGGNKPGLWKTLTREEFYYIKTERPSAESLIGTGVVNNINGLIILPDNWKAPNGITFHADATDCNTNTYSIKEWRKMEAAGAVFLPSTHVREGNKMYMDYDDTGFYWLQGAGIVSGRPATLLIGKVSPEISAIEPSYGLAVRLVK